MEISAVPRTLLDELVRRPRSFQFFQSILILSRAQPTRVEPGIGTDARLESALLRSWPSMVRSGTDIRSLRESADDDVAPAYEMEVSFTGLYGLSSPTPSYFWDYILRHPDSALREFVDIFNSRWIGLFYQAWKRHRWPLLSSGPGTFDPTTRRAFCLIGMGTELHPTGQSIFSDSLESQTNLLAEHPALAAFPSRTRLLAYSSLLAMRTRPPCNMETILLDFFDELLSEKGLVRVEENVFQWAYLSPADTNALGRANSQTGGRSAFVAGVRIPDRMGAFRVHVGPLPIREFLEFLPERASFQRLSDLVRLASPFGLTFDVDLELSSRDVPDWKLGGAADSMLGRLGWTTWAQSGDRSEPGVVRLRPIHAS